MGAPLLDICHADLGYGDRRVLRDVTLSVGATDFLVLHGPNGGGKTTLLRAMAGLLRPLSGRIVRREGLRTGYLPQYRSIDRQFPITVAEVVRSGLAGSKPFWRPYTAAQHTATDTMLERLGITALAARPIEALSGGQWQRTLLGRALIADPELLLLDEPDTHLDAGSRDWLYGTLAEETGHRTIVIVSHDDALTARFTDCHPIHVERGSVEA